MSLRKRRKGDSSLQKITVGLLYAAVKVGKLRKGARLRG
jgi:hypothetical protein